MISTAKFQAKKILIVKLRAIGDVLLSTIVLKSLRSAYPQSTIDFLTEIPSKDVLEGNSCVDAVLVFDSKIQSSLSLLRMIRRQDYDMVIDLFGNPRSAIITLISGARVRVGYRLKWRRHCYNVVVEPRGGLVHNTQFNLDALKELGIPIVEESLSFPIEDEDRKVANDFFRQRGLDESFVVALNPGGGWYTKRWPLGRFAELGDRLVSTCNAKVIVLWGPGEQQSAEEIVSMMTQPAILIPPTSLKQLGAILERTSVMVTNDSGPMHIASVLGTPVVAIFGPTIPELQGPVGTKSIIVRNTKLLCLGCNYTSCPIGTPCMKELLVDDVYREFQRLCKIHSLLPSDYYEKATSEAG